MSRALAFRRNIENVFRTALFQWLAPKLNFHIDIDQ
jgi:hypothetical protein